MAEPQRASGNAGTFRMTVQSWPTERWVAVLTLTALALLILIRRGFRGVGFGGAGVNIG